MYAPRFFLIYYLFVASGLALFAFSFRFKSNVTLGVQHGLILPKAKNEIRFTMFDYYISEKEVPTLYLKGVEMNIDSGTGVQEVDFPAGYGFSRKGMKIRYKANHATMNNSAKKISFFGLVKLKSQDSTINSDKAIYFINQDKFEAFGNVKSNYFDLKTKDKVWIDADEAVSRPQQGLARYLGNVKGRIERARVYESGIYFKSEKMFADINKSYIELQQDVWIKKQEVEALGRRGEIFLDNYNKQLKYYGLYDDVRLKEKVTLPDGKSLTRRAFAEKLEGYARTERIVLTGSPKVIQGRDIIKGNKIILIQNKETIEVVDAHSKLIIK